MKQYLGHWFDEQGASRAALCPEPTEVLARPGGRVSPLFHAVGGSLTELPSQGALVFMYARSPRELLAALGRAQARGSLRGAAVYMTHGLASVVVIFTNAEEVPAWLDRWAAHLEAHDVWWLDSGRVETEAFQLHSDRERVPACPRLAATYSDMPYEVDVELDQFRSNLNFFWSSCRSFAPELVELGAALVDAVETTAEAILENLDATDGDGRFAPTHYACVANLVEINSCLTLLLSQMFSCAGPVSRGSFAVGEYSLLGIGSVARSAWRLYEHVSSVFAQENHIERLRVLANEAPFDSAHLNPYAFDYESWIDKGLDEFPAPDDEPSRKHVIYFSSRWGFHQTMQSVSMSWQCIPSGASREWNLLTFSHEFLHSHLRDLLDTLLLDPSVQLADMVALFNKDDAENWGEAATQFLITSLRWIRKTEVLSGRDVIDPAASTQSERVRQRTDQVELGNLVADQLRFLEEIATHVLDYIYFYDSKDETYVSSLWHSWSLVPNVQPQLDRYLLRTLLALGSMYPTMDSSAAFDDAMERLRNEFRDIVDHEHHGLIREALSMLEDDQHADLRKRLRTRFMASFLLVMFVRRYLVSERVHGQLFADRQADDEGHYAAQPGSFPAGSIDSPIGFLVDRFGTYDTARSRVDVEFQSLWQYLTIL